MWGRKLLQVHRCTGRELLLGDANVSGSILVLLLVGFLVGLLTGAGLTICLRRRKKTALTREQGLSSPGPPMPGNDYTHHGVKHKKTQSALIRDDAVRRSGVTGPLGVGIVLQSIDLSKENQEPGTLAAKLQRHSVDDWSVVDLSSEHDCNLNRSTFKPILETAVQRNAHQDKEKVPGLELGAISRGTIKAGWGRSGYAHSTVEGISAMSIREAAAAGAAALPGRVPQPKGNAGKAAPPPPPPPPPAANASDRPVPASNVANKQEKAGERKRIGPAQAVDLAQQAAQAGAELRRRADEQKQKVAAGVAPAYDLDDLDDEWKALLNELEDRLYQEGKQGMDAEDRAVAVRSLLVSTARETAEAALAKALDDIERHRHALRR